MENNDNKLITLKNLKVYSDHLLSRTNTTAFDPTLTYDPATKKYADDTLNAVEESLEYAQNSDIENMFGPDFATYLISYDYNNDSFGTNVITFEATTKDENSQELKAKIQMFKEPAAAFRRINIGVDRTERI